MALLMTKNLLDVLFPEFKNELPEYEYAKGQTKKEERGCSKNIMVIGCFGTKLRYPQKLSLKTCWISLSTSQNSGGALWV